MAGAKKGLVAPQNTFLETIIRRCAESDTNFILANAQILDNPIVYCNVGFSRLAGFSRADLMQKSCSCNFMYGEQTNKEDIEKIERALASSSAEQLEIRLYKKNRNPLWLLMHIAPIRNDKDVPVLILCQFKDITALKQPLEDESAKGLNRILQIARIAKSRQQMNLDSARHQMNGGLGLAIAANIANTDTLPLYKLETPKTPRRIVLHYSPIKVAWDWLILSLTFYTAVIIPFNVAFQTRSNENIPLTLFDSVVDLIFFVDIILHFHTTFVGPGGEVVSNAKIIRKNYFNSWFFIDLLSCLPYDAFDLIQDADPRISSLFSAIKVMRLLRLGRVARQLDNYMEYGLATLLLLLGAYLIVAHWMACIWYTIGEFGVKQYLLQPSTLNANKNNYGWLVQLSDEMQMLYNYTLSADSDLPIIVGGPSKTSAYITALYFTLTCMTTVGFGNVAAWTDVEKGFAACMLVISALLYASIFGHMTTIIGQMTSATMRYREMINNIHEFAKLYEIPKTLAERVMDYVVSTWATTKGVDTAKVLSYCPKDMKADITVHLNRKVFNDNNCFRLASDGCLRALAMHFHTNHSAPGDLLYHTGESVEGLWFVVSGSLEVIQDEEIVAILGAGDVFGDEFWREPTIGQSAANVRALTYADLHVIKRDKLLEVLNFYQTFANSFARSITLTYNLRKRLKFRKVVDVKREKELEERRKNEHIIIGPDHPVRLLLQRIRERHKSVEGTAEKTPGAQATPGQPQSGKKFSFTPSNLSNVLNLSNNVRSSPPMFPLIRTPSVAPSTATSRPTDASRRQSTAFSFPPIEKPAERLPEPAVVISESIFNDEPSGGAKRKSKHRSKSRHRHRRHRPSRDDDDAAQVGSAAIDDPTKQLDFLTAMRNDLRNQTTSFLERLQMLDGHIQQMVTRLTGQPATDEPPPIDPADELMGSASDLLSATQITQLSANYNVGDDGMHLAVPQNRRFVVPTVHTIPNFDDLNESIGSADSSGELSWSTSLEKNRRPIR